MDHGNQNLKHVGAAIFNSVTDLEYVFLVGSGCINSETENFDSLKELEQKLENQCPPKIVEKITVGSTKESTEQFNEESSE